MMIILDEPGDEVMIQGPAGHGPDDGLIEVAWRMRPDSRMVLTVAVPGPDESAPDTWEFDPVERRWVPVEDAPDVP